MVRTSENANTLTFDYTDTQIDVAVDSQAYGSVTIVGFGNSPLTIDAGTYDRILSNGEQSNLKLANVKLINADAGYGSLSTGGAIQNAGTLTVLDSEFTDNLAMYGGAIYNTGSLTVYDSQFVTNEGSRYGGGIYSINGTVTVANSEFTGNDSFFGGAGIYNEETTTTITNSTITGQIYGVYMDVFPVTLVNTIVAHNFINIEGTLTKESRNNLIDVESVFTQAPELDEYGSTTNTSTMDLRPTKDSGAIDAGDNSVVTSEKDMDGYDRISNGTVDIGAYEYQHCDFEIPAAVNTLSDVFDLSDGKWSLREALYYAEAGSTITFDESLKGGTIFVNEQFRAANVTIDAGDLGIVLSGQRQNRIMYTSGDVTLNGFTFIDGKAEGSGGAIYNNGNLTVTNSKFSGNISGYHGGAIVSFGRLTVADCEFTGNETLNYGGAICAYEMIMTDTVISGNRSGRRG